MSEQEDLEVPENEDETQKSIYELFETDPTMERQGIVIDFGAYGKFKVARAASSNIAYADSFKRHYRPHQKTMRRGNLSENVAQKLLVQIYADSIVLAWENVYGRDMKPIPYNRANVVKIMTELPDLFAQIITESQNAESYKKEFIEDAAKN